MWVKYSWTDDMVQVEKNEMWASEVCFACLTWLYGLLFRTLISLTNVYTSCGRPALNLIERSWRSLLAWVGPFSLQVELKMYSNEL